MTVLTYCCACNELMEPRATTGKEIYPKRQDLHELKFWKCDECGNYVGSHKHTGMPLGCIPSPEIRNARTHIHALMDPLWRDGTIKRRRLYAMISKELGREYHTAEIHDIEEARDIYRIILRIKKELTQ